MKKALIILIVFIVLSIVVFFVPHFNLDILISEKIQGINSSLFSNTMWLVSSIGNQPLMVYIVGLTGLLLYILKLQTEAIFCTLSVAGSVLLGSLIKVLINRARPSSDLVQVMVSLSDKSYPSGHVLAFTVFFGYLLFLLLKKTSNKAQKIILSIILIFFIVTIGISRIYLGVHWASDVLGGYLLGAICLIFAIRLYNSYHGKR